MELKVLGWQAGGGKVDGQLGGGKGRRGDGRMEGRRKLRQKLPMLASQCGYVMRARDTDLHTLTYTLADTHLGLSLAPRLISGTQRPQTEVAEDTQWEQGLKAWFTCALREGAREAERQWETGREREGPTELNRHPNRGRVWGGRNRVRRG